MANVLSAGATHIRGGQPAQRSVAITINDPPITKRFSILWDSAIGKKIVMAVTGAVLVAFVDARIH